MTNAAAGRIRVLHVDDEPEFADLAATFLERESDRFEVETATSADDGLAVLADRPPDCIVSDYNMPGTDGIEFLDAVRDTHPELPFILFTGRGSEQVASDAIAADVTDYLQKGSGSEQYELLANRIQNAVQARRDAQAAARQEELMRLTEFAGDTGGWEIDVEDGALRLTDGTRRLIGLPDEADVSLDDAIELYHPDDREDVRQTLDRVAETGEDTRDVWRLQPPDGDERVLDVTVTAAATDGDGTTLRGAIHDVTDSRERQRNLEQIETLFQHAQDSLFLVDATGEFTIERVNPAYEEATGLSAERIRGETLRDVLGDEPGATAEERYARCVEQQEPLQYEERIRLDGELTDWLTRIAPVVIDGTVEYVVGSTRDVTEQKRRQRELRAERQFVQQALDALDDLFYVVGVDGSVQRWNDRLPEVTGYPESELAGMDAVELFLADDRATIADAVESALSGGEPTVEADLLTADGRRVPYELTGAHLTGPDGETAGLVGIGRDLTERRQRQRRFRALVEESSDVISVVDTDGRYQYQSPSLERILGHDPEETVGERVWEYIHPDDLEILENTFESWVADPDTAGPVEYRARHADGSWRWMEARGNNQLDNPAVDGYVVNSRDVTDRKERQQELEQTRGLMANMETLADVGAWEYDPASETLVMTDGAYRLYGLDPDASLTLDEAFEHFEPDDRDVLRGRFDRCLETGEPYEEDVRLTTAGGTRRWVTARGEWIDTDESGGVVRGYVQDITDRKQMQRDLRRERDLVTGIVETSPVGISVVDADGGLSFMNERAKTIGGWSREDLEETADDDARYDLVDEHGEPLDGGEDPFERVMDQETVVRDQVVGMCRSSGERVWLSVNGAPQRNDDGELERAIFTFEDVTDRR